MNNFHEQPELLWDDLLSQEQNRIQAAFSTLNPEEKKSVLDHLLRMSSEPGWHPAQSESARAALVSLGY